MKIAGVTYFSVDGTTYDVGKSATVIPDATSVESVAGLTGVAGYSETNEAPAIEVEMLETDPIALVALSAKRDATVQIANDAATYILRNAWRQGRPETNMADGTRTMRFEGKSMTVVAA